MSSFLWHAITQVNIDSVVENQLCKGALSRDVQCGCRYVRPVKILRSMAYSGTTCAVIDMHAKGGDNRIQIPDTGRYMRQIAHTPVAANSERKHLAGFQLTIHWSYDTNDGIYPHRNTRFIEQQCLCEGECPKSRMKMKMDMNPNRGHTMSLHQLLSLSPICYL